MIAVAALAACGAQRAAAPPPGAPLAIKLSDLKEHSPSGDLTIALLPEARGAMEEQGVKRATVMLKVCVTTEGEVSTAEVIRTNHAPPVVVKSVIDEILKWRFSPFVVDGRRTPACAPYLFAQELAEESR